MGELPHRQDFRARSVIQDVDSVLRIGGDNWEALQSPARRPVDLIICLQPWYLIAIDDGSTAWNSHGGSKLAHRYVTLTLT